MDQNTKQILALIKLNQTRLRPKYLRAAQKFQLWQEYHGGALGDSAGKPHTIAMAFTQRLLTYTGIAESLFSEKIEPKDKVDMFFRELDEETKLLIMLAIRRGSSNRISKSRRSRNIRAYVDRKAKRASNFDKYFQDVISASRKKDKGRGMSLWRLRCRLVHSGEYVGVWILGSSGEPLSVHSPSNWLWVDENIITLEEMFLRGICTKAKLHVARPVQRVSEILRRWHISHKNVRIPDGLIVHPNLSAPEKH